MGQLLRCECNTATSARCIALPPSARVQASHHWYPIAFPDAAAPPKLQPCNGIGEADVGWHVDMSRYSWGYIDGSFRWTVPPAPLPGDAHRPLCILLYLLSDCGPGEGGQRNLPCRAAPADARVDACARAPRRATRAPTLSPHGVWQHSDRARRAHRLLRHLSPAQARCWCPGPTNGLYVPHLWFASIMERPHRRERESGCTVPSLPLHPTAFAAADQH